MKNMHQKALKSSPVDQIEVPRSIDGLIFATEVILDPGVSGVIIRALETRKKWAVIKRDYETLRRGGSKKDYALAVLSKKHHYSEKAIERIVYER